MLAELPASRARGIRPACRSACHLRKTARPGPCRRQCADDVEQQTGKRVFTILQLRLNPSNIALRQDVAAEKGKLLCDLTYVTARGQWYYVSWKGQEAKSGGIATNIGVHFYDLLGFLFGKPNRIVVYHRAMDCAAGYLEYEHAKVRWFLSINGRDLPDEDDEGLHAGALRSGIVCAICPVTFASCTRQATARYSLGAGSHLSRHAKPSKRWQRSAMRLCPL